MKWRDAYSFCNNFNLNLAIIDSKEEESELLNTLKILNLTGSEYIWIGATDIGEAFNWYWAKTGEPIGFNLHFHPNEPDDPGNQQYLIILLHSESMYIGNTFGYIDAFALCQRVL